MADQAAGLFSPWLRTRRLAAALPHVRGRVLDFGCGVGMVAAHIAPDRYLGIDADDDSLTEARRRFPRHCFSGVLPPNGSFDTILALAVLEHVRSPVALLASLRGYLVPEGHIVMTTPHPRGDALHTIGARLGLLSASAAEEHEKLLDRSSLVDAAAAAKLEVALYRPFLAGLNQLAILQPRP